MRAERGDGATAERVLSHADNKVALHNNNNNKNNTINLHITYVLFVCLFEVSAATWFDI